MKILLVTDEYPPFKGGVANYYYNLALNFPYEDDLVILNNNKLELDEKKLPFSWLKSISSINKKLKKKDIDYVLAGQILPYGTSICILSFFKSFSYGVFLHGLDFSMAISKKRKKFITKIILRRSSKIIAANTFVANQLKLNFPQFSEKVVIVNPGLPQVNTFSTQIELNDLKNKYKLENKTILFSLGRLVKRKGFDKTIEALSMIVENDLKDLVYVVAGTGPDEVYLRSLVPSSLRDKVIFLGKIGEDIKWSWFNLCDIFIMPSRNIGGDYEGFGIVYLEANLCAKPVIAGNAGGVGDAVVNNFSGLIVNPESSEDIARAITNLKEDQEFRIKLGLQGQKRAKEEFEWSKLAKDLRDLLN